MDSSQCARTWALLGLRCSAAVAALWARQDTAGGNDDDVTVGEFLLELTGQAGRKMLGQEQERENWMRNVPLLGTVPALEERDGDEDDNRLATVADLDL